MPSSKYLDAASVGTILLTFIFFVAAVFCKGLTHDLLLEAGVFLVSVKLILMSHKNDVPAVRLDERLDRIENALTERRLG